MPSHHQRNQGDDYSYQVAELLFVRHELVSKMEDLSGRSERRRR